MEQTHTRFYPHARDALVRTLLLDLVVLALLAFLAWLGLKVHDTVQELGALGRGVTARERRSREASARSPTRSAASR